MKANFARSLTAVLQHEGGFVDNPHDKGGATNQGVTQAVYDDWRAGRSLPPRSVRFLSLAEVTAIYRDLYWDKVKGDDLPSGLDYCVFDFAVNSGVNRASRFLQRAVGAIEDGRIGPRTLELAKSFPPRRIIGEICEARLFFLKTLDSFKYFGKGWTGRVEGVRALAESMA